MKLLTIITNLFRLIFGGKKKSTTTKPKPTQPQPVTPPSPTPSQPEVKEEEPTTTTTSSTTEKPIEELPKVVDLKIERIGSGSAPDYKITNGTHPVEFKGFKRGYYTVGQQLALDFIDKHKALLANLNLTDSSIKVIQSVSDNEGNLDAINTWDNSFLTFGMFQWALGAKGNSGELPALLKKIKIQQPDLYHHFFGQFNLDVTSTTGPVYGHFLLKDKKIDTVSEKNEFRTAGWGYRFWLAGQHPDIQAIQIEHAIGRLKTFYWKKPKGWNNKMSEVVTSEYGVALILDNHVNRPGYVDNCLMNAWKEVGLNNDPNTWTTDDELKLINAYIKIRETYGKSPMTDAAKRARNTIKYLDQGKVSAERGSFMYEERASTRGLGPTPLEDIIPIGYDALHFEDIRHYDEENESAPSENEG